MSDIRTANTDRSAATAGGPSTENAAADCQTWDHERDEMFFLVVQRLFSPTFLAGATALLSSYDED